MHVRLLKKCLGLLSEIFSPSHLMKKPYSGYPTIHHILTFLIHVLNAYHPPCSFYSLPSNFRYRLFMVTYLCVQTLSIFHLSGLFSRFPMCSFLCLFFNVTLFILYTPLLPLPYLLVLFFKKKNSALSSLKAGMMVAL